MPTVVYCNDIALIGRSVGDIETLFTGLVSFCDWAGLEINPGKSAYTHSKNAAPANLLVPLTLNRRPGRPMPVVSLAHSHSYHYMGVMVNLALNWSKQCTYL